MIVEDEDTEVGRTVWANKFNRVITYIRSNNVYIYPQSKHCETTLQMRVMVTMSWITPNFINPLSQHIDRASDVYIANFQVDLH